jgi:hypothetical protein
MIVSRAHDFGFVHIGKCAGSTIREQLRDIDDLGQRFYRTTHVEGLGKINGNHVPLQWLARYFPDDLAALRSVTSYTVTREPLDRFVSSVAQRLRADGAEPGDMKPADLLAAGQRIASDLAASGEGLPAIKYTIFMRQTEYVHLDGEKVVDRVYPMESLAALFAEMEARHGLSLIRDKVWNPTVTYRLPGSSGPLKRMKDVAKKVLPMKSYVALREAGVKAFTTRGVPKLTEALAGSPEIREFVAAYYAGDARLHADALASVPPPSRPAVAAPGH